MIWLAILYGISAYLAYFCTISDMLRHYDTTDVFMWFVALILPLIPGVNTALALGWLIDEYLF